MGPTTQINCHSWRCTRQSALWQSWSQYAAERHLGASPHQGPTTGHRTLLRPYMALPRALPRTQHKALPGPDRRPYPRPYNRPPPRPYPVALSRALTRHPEQSFRRSSGTLHHKHCRTTRRWRRWTRGSRGSGHGGKGADRRPNDAARAASAGTAGRGRGGTDALRRPPSPVMGAAV